MPLLPDLTSVRAPVLSAMLALIVIPALPVVTNTGAAAVPGWRRAPAVPETVSTPEPPLRMPLVSRLNWFRLTAIAAPELRRAVIVRVAVSVLAVLML